MNLSAVACNSCVHLIEDFAEESVFVNKKNWSISMMVIYNSLLRRRYTLGNSLFAVIYGQGKPLARIFLKISRFRAMFNDSFVPEFGGY